MKVTEVMHTPAVTCRPEDTLEEAALTMAARGVGCVLVIDRVGELAGIVTDRDIAVRGVGHGRSGDIPVEEVMSRDVATVDTHADVTTAVATMVKWSVRRLPVVDGFGNVHGLVALDDLIRLSGRQADELGDILRDQASALHTSI
jgi:CBS domain-containing protein